MSENYDKFWQEMNDKASFKDFYKEPTDEKELLRWKIDRASRQISETIKDLQNALEGLK